MRRSLTVLLLLSGCRPEAVWKCDFELPAEVTTPYVEDSQQWQKVTGVPALPGEDKGFQLQVAPQSVASQYVQNHIAQTAGHDGRITRALFQSVLGTDPDFEFGQTRSNWFFVPNQEIDQEFYESFWVFFQPDLLSVMASSNYNWRQIWECKMGPEGAPPNFRCNLGIIYRPSTGLVWQAATGHLTTPVPPDQWQAVLPGVKFGEWQKIEVYLRQHPTDGLFVARVDGRLVAKYFGQTCVAEGDVSKWKLATLYTDTSKITRGPHWQYVDDIMLCADAEAMEAIE